jgi:hypothetical protein
MLESLAMPSPFPGMDPFLESQEWDDFHARFNLAISDALGPVVKPRYLVRVERRVYIEHPSDLEAETKLRVGDVAIVTGDAASPAIGIDGGVAVAKPVVCNLSLPEERRETYLVIRDRELQMVVTVIETLSPANKRRGGDGWREYLMKRDQVLASPSHLVEIDLLRGGARLPMKDPLPPGDYYAIVSRAERRPRADVYPWTLEVPMPTISIPLLPEDDYVPLNLQQVFETVYDRAAYDLSLDYGSDLTPPLSSKSRRWLPS